MTEFTRYLRCLYFSEHLLEAAAKAFLRNGTITFAFSIVSQPSSQDREELVRMLI